LRKIENKTILLVEICENKRGAEIGKKDLKNTNSGKPILIGGDVQKYSFEFTNAKIDVNHKEYKRLKEYFENENLILLRRVSKDLVAAFSENQVAYSKNLYGIKVKDFSVKFILGLLNSKLLNFYYKKKFSTKKEDIFPEFQTYFVEQLPIPNIPLSEQQPLIDLVNEILQKKKENEGADVSALEREIDRLVYGLYGVSEMEIEIMEKG
jgi:hypothetical protein